MRPPGCGHSGLGTAATSKPHPQGLALGYARCSGSQAARIFSLAPALTRPQNPADSSPDTSSLQHLPGEGASRIVAERTASRSPLSARFSFHSPLPPGCCSGHLRLLSPDHFPLVFPLPPHSPCCLPSPCSSPRFSPLGSLAVSRRCLHLSLPGASWDEMDFVPEPSPAFIRGGKIINATTPWKFAGGQCPFPGGPF